MTLGVSKQSLITLLHNSSELGSPRKLSHWPVNFFLPGQPKLLVSQPGGVQPRLIVPAQHLTLLTSNGGPGSNTQTIMEPKKEGLSSIRLVSRSDYWIKREISLSRANLTTNLQPWLDGSERSATVKLNCTWLLIARILLNSLWAVASEISFEIVLLATLSRDLVIF